MEVASNKCPRNGCSEGFPKLLLELGGELHFYYSCRLSVCNFLKDVFHH